MAQFDVEAARKAGYSNTEIADFLAAQAGLDAAAAREHYSDDEIIAELGAAAQTVAEPKVGTPGVKPEATAPAAKPEVQVVETPTRVVMGPSGSPEPQLPEGFAEKYRDYITREAKAGTLNAPALEAFVKAETGVEPANAEDVVQHYKEFGQVSPDARRIPAPVITPPEALKKTTAAALGAEDVATFGLAPQINAIFKMAGQAEANALEGGLPAPTDTFEGALQQSRAEIGGYQQAAPLSYVGGQLGGALLPWGRNPRTIGGMAAQGALTGGAYGVGSAVGRGEDLHTAAEQGVLGTLTGGAIGVGGGTLARMAPAKRLEPQRVQEAALAAERQNMDLPSTLVSAHSAVAAKDLGQSAKETVKLSEEAVPEVLGERAAALASRYGTPAMDTVDLGQRVQRGAARWIKTMRGDATKLYEKGEELTKDVVVKTDELSGLLKAKREELVKLPKTNKALIDVINDVASDIETGSLSPRNVRDLRTNLWNRLGASDIGLSPSDKTRLIAEMSQAATNDMRNTLTGLAETFKQPKFTEALSAFDAADAMWKKQSATVKRTLSAVLGKSADDILEDGPDVWGANLSPEAAVSALKRFSGKGHRSLVQLMGTLDEGTQRTVRASLANSLGRKPDGAFDPALFIKQLDNIPERTQTTLFGREGVDALKDLKSIGGLLTDRVGKGEGGSYWVRRMKLALASSGVGAVVGGAMLPGAGALPGAAIAAATILGTKKQITDPIIARMLVSPDIAKRIAKLARAGNPNERKAQIESLTRYAERVPEFRDAIAGFVERLTGAPELEGKAPAVSVGGKKPEVAEEVPVDITADTPDVPYDTLIGAINGQEGTGDNPGSSAVGKGQFIDETFAGYARKLLPAETDGMDDASIVRQFRGAALPDGSPIEDAMQRLYVDDNKAILSQIGAPLTPTNQYLAYFLGGTDVGKVLSAPGDMSLADVLGEKAEQIITANPFLKDMTVADVIGWARSVMEKRLKR